MPIAPNDTSGIDPQLAALLKAQVAMEAYKRRFTPGMLMGPPEPQPLDQQQINQDWEQGFAGADAKLQAGNAADIAALVSGAANKQRMAPPLMPLAPAGSLQGGQRVPTSLIAGSFTQGEMSPGRLANAMERGALRKNRMYGGGDAMMMLSQLQQAKAADQMFPEEQQQPNQMAGGDGQDPLFALAGNLANANPGIGQRMKARALGQSDPAEFNLAKLAALGPALAAVGDRYRADVPFRVMEAQTKEKELLANETMRMDAAKEIARNISGSGPNSLGIFTAEVRRKIPGIKEYEIAAAWKAAGGKPGPVPQPGSPVPIGPDVPWWRRLRMR